MGKFALGAAVTVAAVSLAGNFLMYSRYSSHRPLIDVNNQVIRRKDLDDRLDYLYSNNVLRGMIINDLIMQEAAKEGVVPTPEEMAQAKAEIQRTKPSTITLAQQSDPTLELFNEQLKAQLALRNLQTKNVKVSEADIEQFYAQHKASFMLPAQTSSTVIFAKDAVAADTAIMMLKNGTSTTVIAGQPGIAVVGVNAHSVPTLPKDVASQVLQMNVGDIKTFDVDGMKMIIRAISVNSPGVPALALIHDQVETMAKLAKAPSAQVELAQLVHNAHITVESDKYSGAVPTIGSQTASAQ